MYVKYGDMSKIHYISEHNGTKQNKKIARHFIGLKNDLKLRYFRYFRGIKGENLLFYIGRILIEGTRD